MKVIIFYAKYGGGHMSAARSIEDCIKTNYKNIEVKLIDFMEYANKPLNKVTTTAYSEMAKKAPRTWGRLYRKSQKGPVAHISTLSNELLSIKVNGLLKEEKPDLIISTHPFASQICGFLIKYKKLNSKIATVLTDFAPHDQWLVFNEYIDYFFVASEEMKNSLLQKEISANKVFSTGIPISSRFSKEYDKNLILQEFNLSHNKKTVLFFGGGEFGLGKNYTLEVFKVFLESSCDLQIVAISGKNEKMKQGFENLVIENHKKDCVHIFEYTNKVPELMAISDLVVTKPGGLTSSESLASGLPIIIINPIPGQEEENASYLEEKGCAVWLKKDDDVKSIINSLLSDNKKIENMKKNSMLIAKPNSTYDICKILFE